MDIALENGSFKVDSRGYPISISGLNDILQRAIIRLLVKKGSFVYDENLGSNLSTLKSSYISDGTLKQRALDYIKEALKPMKEISVLDLSLELTDYYEKLRLNIKIMVNEKVSEISIEV